MNSINPATGDVVETHTEDDVAAINTQLEHFQQAFESWRNRPIEEREFLLSKVADVLRDNVKEFASQITKEIGKPISQSVNEVEKYT